MAKGFQFAGSLALLITCISCHPTSIGPFTVSVDLRNSYPGKCLLYRLSMDGNSILTDSFQLVHLYEKFVLRDTKQAVPCIYQLQFIPAGTAIYLISDAVRLEVTINANDPQAYEVFGSQGSVALMNLQHRQKTIVDSLYIIRNRITQRTPDEAALVKQSAAMEQRLHAMKLAFADTCRSPLATLFIAQQIDFQGNLTGQRHFAKNLARRFPKDNQVKDYISGVKQFLSILENEWEVGDSPPLNPFTDINGQSISLKTCLGKYCLLEFWAAYCPQCLKTLEHWRKLFRQLSTSGFQMITFSLDTDRVLLENVLSQKKFPWVTISDSEGWSGNIARTYQPDSIPYHFLLGPDGRILAKNLPQVQLEKFLEREWAISGRKRFYSR